MSKRKTNVIIYDPRTKNRDEYLVPHRRYKKRRIHDGHYIDPERDWEVPLNPNLAWSGPKGTEVWIDAQQAIQMDYKGGLSFVGIDGRDTIADTARNVSKNLQTRGWKLEKFVWPAVLLLMGFLATIIVVSVI